MAGQEGQYAAPSDHLLLQEYAHVGTAKSGAGKSELALDDGGVGVDIDRLDVNLDSLDGGERTSALGEDSGLRELRDDLQHGKRKRRARNGARAGGARGRTGPRN